LCVSACSISGDRLYFLPKISTVSEDSAALPSGSVPDQSLVFNEHPKIRLVDAGPAISNVCVGPVAGDDRGFVFIIGFPTGFPVAFVNSSVDIPGTCLRAGDMVGVFLSMACKQMYKNMTRVIYKMVLLSCLKLPFFKEAAVEKSRINLVKILSWVFIGAPIGLKSALNNWQISSIHILAIFVFGINQDLITTGIFLSKPLQWFYFLTIP